MVKTKTITEKNKEMRSFLSGAILLVEIPKRKVGKEPVFTGSRGFKVPTNKAEHVLTIDCWDHAEKKYGDVLGIGIVYTESFDGYLKDSNPTSLHPSFRGKNLQQIIEEYIKKNNIITNKKIKSKILKIGYSPEFKYDSKNDQKNHLFTDPEYTDGQEYLTLKEYIKYGKPVILKKTISGKLEIVIN